MPSRNGTYICQERKFGCEEQHDCVLFCNIDLCEIPKNGGSQMGKERKILIIDDDPLFTSSVVELLQASKYEVVTATNPDEGEKRIMSEKPDLLLLDIMMDSIFDGFSLCHKIKTDAKYDDYRNMPVIFVSAVKEKVGTRFQFNGEDQGMKGPDGYLDKPVKPAELLNCIESHLNSK
jgi:CheY-like chemotaxis protein